MHCQDKSAQLLFGLAFEPQMNIHADPINPLLAKLQIFQQKHKHLSLISTFPPYWLYDTGSWNSFSQKTRSYKSYLVNIMGADNLEALGARASATMILP